MVSATLFTAVNTFAFAMLYLMHYLGIRWFNSIQRIGFEMNALNQKATEGGLTIEDFKICFENNLSTTHLIYAFRQNHVTLSQSPSTAITRQLSLEPPLNH